MFCTRLITFPPILCNHDLLPLLLLHFFVHFLLPPSPVNLCTSILLLLLLLLPLLLSIALPLFFVLVFAFLQSASVINWSWKRSIVARPLHLTSHIGSE